VINDSGSVLRFPQVGGARLKRLSSLTSAARTPDDASASDHARKRQGDAKVLLKLPIGTTARSSRSTISVIRAATMPMPNWLASLPSMMVMFS
jgi:hypothetical protein